MIVVFKKEDFSLCKVPVPKGYPQSQTHCGVAWIGERVIMTTSPYPAKNNSIIQSYLSIFINKVKKLFGIALSRSAESYENPCIFISEKSDVIPCSFNLMQDRPLMDYPDNYYGYPSYNSDPDLYVEGDIAYIMNRAVYRMENKKGEKQYNIRIHLISGKVEDNKFRFLKNEVVQDSFDRMYISPCLTKINNRYVFFELETNTYNDGRSFDGLFCKKGETIAGVFNNIEWEQVQVKSGDWLPWHMSVFHHKRELYAIVACIKRGEGHRCWQMLGKFNDDLSELHIFNTPLADIQSYRSSAYVKNGLFVLYNTTVREHFAGGESVDGREIVMASMPFDEMLNKLQ